MELLTPRRQAILGLVVRAYIETAQPIGSKSLVERYRLRYSPATIRNELAALEEMGYLTHPHTSAGRVPTEEGYRYFVEHLLGEVELPLSERLMIRHQFHQVRLELDQWARLAAAVLAHTARSAALATAPQASQSRFKHLELISLHDTVILLVLVLVGGTVKQQMLTLDGPVSQEQLSRISNELNACLNGATSEELVSRAAHITELGRQVVILVRDIMRRVDGYLSDQVYRAGLTQVLEAPEFAEGESARRIVQVLEERSLLESILASLPDINTVQVIIGGEGRWQTLRDISLVLSRYGVQEGATGLLGVIGPIRMPYDRAISAVRYVSMLMSDLLHEWYGGEPS
ncbi:MAG: heat-inducible transcriptional repressor HrcA [Anaerolineae bacterium]|nr:heat-inducible transcriptional repressor HrcA [Anaerolineae bacterium]MDW8100316.1 heat-inducible transcriptional repressor HrcA [Anaerolineae bacterium]